MTTRYSHITIALEADMRDDDAESLLNAIRQLRGVLSVEAQVANPEVWIGTERARERLGQALWEVLYPKQPKR